MYTIHASNRQDWRKAFIHEYPDREQRPLVGRQGTARGQMLAGGNGARFWLRAHEGAPTEFCKRMALAALAEGRAWRPQALPLPG
jgi:hypothetical protein